MSSFPEAWLNELLAHNDIVSVVSDYVALKEKGRRFWGLCPFHGEKTASFSVNADKQFYYCFGCHAGGDAIRFIMEMEKLSFVDAVKFLARRANMQLPDMIDDSAMQKEREEKERLYQACKDAALFFHERLKSPQGRPAQEYLLRRGVQPRTVAAFGLGFSPPGWDHLLKHMLDKGYRPEELQAAGLAVKKGDRYFDMFRGRVMFPIIGGYQRVIGFGGRALGDETPKYINTPDTTILNMQKGKSPDSLVLVEGYMDVVSLHQGGVSNAVATLGTALTPQQARLIKRYTNQVYLAYDGDAAGQSANLRGLDILAAEGIRVKVITFPQGQDPDDFIRAEGLEGFEKRKSGALTLQAFKLRNLAAQFDLMTEDGREGYAKAGSAFIATLSLIEQERYYPVLAQSTGFSIEALRAAGEEGRISSQNSPPPGPSKNRPSNLRNTRITKEGTVSANRISAEQTVLRSALEERRFAKEAFGMPELFQAPGHLALLQALQQAYQAGNMAEQEELNLPVFLAGLPDELAGCAAAALSAPQADDAQACFRDGIHLLQHMNITQNIKELQQRASRDDISREERLELAKRIGDLNEQLHQQSGAGSSESFAERQGG